MTAFDVVCVTVHAKHTELNYCKTCALQTPSIIIIKDVSKKQYIGEDSENCCLQAEMIIDNKKLKTVSVCCMFCQSTQRAYYEIIMKKFKLIGAVQFPWSPWLKVTQTGATLTHSGSHAFTHTHLHQHSYKYNHVVRSASSA